MIRNHEPVTKNEEAPSAKREDAISNSEVHLSKIEPAQVRKNIRVKAGFELATFRLRKGSQQEIASSERGVELATYIAYRGN